MSWFVALKKFRLTCLVLCAACFALILTGCGRSAKDYTGTWMGLDDSGENYAVYQCDIAAREDGEEFTIRMIQYRYKISGSGKFAVWEATNPHYFNGYLDKEGNLVSDIGVIKAKPSTFQLLYGDVIMTRRAKNTELKFKRIARDHLEKVRPDLIFN